MQEHNQFLQHLSKELLLVSFKSLLNVLPISAREFLTFFSIKCLSQHAFVYSLNKGPSKILLLQSHM